MTATHTAETATGTETTTVEVRPTGHVRAEIGEPSVEFTFEGKRLRAFLTQFFEAYDVRDLVMAEADDEAETEGWADVEDPPGEWAANPPGERTRTYARVVVDGTFNEHLDGLDTELAEGDRVALLYPFIFCC